MLTEALMGGELFTLLCAYDTFDAATARFYLARVGGPYGSSPGRGLGLGLAKHVEPSTLSPNPNPKPTGSLRL